MASERVDPAGPGWDMRVWSCACLPVPPFLALPLPTPPSEPASWLATRARRFPCSTDPSLLCPRLYGGLTQPLSAQLHLEGPPPLVRATASHPSSTVLPLVRGPPPLVPIAVWDGRDWLLRAGRVQSCCTLPGYEIVVRARAHERHAPRKLPELHPGGRQPYTMKRSEKREAEIWRNSHRLCLVRMK